MINGLFISLFANRILMQKLLIVNADDLGLSPGVNRGIVQSHLNGIVTSTSLMICGKFARPGVDLALKHAPNLEIGLHFTLTGECSPISRGQTLVAANGEFPSYQEWLKIYRQLNEEEIEYEITAQWNEFVRLIGQHPHHVDSHHYICFKHPAALRTLIRLISETNVPVRYRGNIDENQDIPSDSRQEIHDMLTRSHFRYPDNCIKSFYGKDATVAYLMKTLESLPANSISELCCHPGIVDPLLRSSYKQHREVELSVLTDRRIQQFITANKIQLSNYIEAFHQ